MTPSHDGYLSRLRHNFGGSIVVAGGIPLLLDLYDREETLEELMDNFDGILFSGGPDIDPAIYGEEKEEKCGEISAERDKFEIALYKIAYKRNMPMLGVCRGIQLMNVAAGGTLVQHYDGHQGVTHDVTIDKDSLLHSFIGKDIISTNSYHHQAVKKCAPIYTPVAYSHEQASGDVIEAMEDKNALFNVGIQWHPEILCFDHNDENALAIFKAFVDASEKYMLAKNGKEDK